MRIKGEIIIQNNTKSGYLFGKGDSGGCYVNRVNRRESAETLTSTK